MGYCSSSYIFLQAMFSEFLKDPSTSQTNSCSLKGKETLGVPPLSWCLLPMSSIAQRKFIAHTVDAHIHTVKIPMAPASPKYPTAILKMYKILRHALLCMRMGTAWRN